MNIVLNKKDVAQRQLATAIRLFFEKDDSVSIYSLAANAWEIIDVLCNKLAPTAYLIKAAKIFLKRRT